MLVRQKQRAIGSNMPLYPILEVLTIEYRYARRGKEWVKYEVCHLENGACVALTDLIIIDSADVEILRLEAKLTYDTSDEKFSRRFRRRAP